MHQTLLHGSAFRLEQSDAAAMSAMRTEADAMRILRGAVREPIAAYLRETSGGMNNLRVSIRQRMVGEARNAIAALFGGIYRLKHVFVFDEDIDIYDDAKVLWAVMTRTQADRSFFQVPGSYISRVDPTGYPPWQAGPGAPRLLSTRLGIDATKPLDPSFPETAEPPKWRDLRPDDYLEEPR